VEGSGRAGIGPERRGEGNKNSLSGKRTIGRKIMDVGKPQRTIYVEPLELPEPLRQPTQEPVAEPQQVPEKVPERSF